MDNLSSVLVDSEREISRVTSSLDLCHAEGGFVRPECYNQYVSFIKFIMWTVFFSSKFHDNTQCVFIKKITLMTLIEVQSPKIALSKLLT